MERIERPELRLVGEDGNAFAILGRAMKVARKAGWTVDEAKAVIDKATEGDYNHLLRTMIETFNVDPYDEDDEED